MGAAMHQFGTMTLTIGIILLIILTALAAWWLTKQWLASWSRWPLRRRLLFLLSVAEIVVTFSLLFFILKYKFEVAQYFASLDEILSLDAWRQFLVAKLGVILLALGLLHIFWASRAEAKNGLNIITGLFTKNNTPTEWDSVDGHRSIVPLTVGFNLLFLALAWFVDRMELFSIAMAIYYVMSSFHNRLLFANLTRLLNDPQYAPAAIDPLTPYIYEKRRVVKEFLRRRPVAMKDALVAIACLAVWCSTIAAGLGFKLVDANILLATMLPTA
jgi:hypothetical protein